MNQEEYLEMSEAILNTCRKYDGKVSAQSMSKALLSNAILVATQCCTKHDAAIEFVNHWTEALIKFYYEDIIESEENTK